MDHTMSYDLEERIRQYEEERKRLEEVLDSQNTQRIDPGQQTEDFNGYLADWYME